MCDGVLRSCGIGVDCRRGRSCRCHSSSSSSRGPTFTRTDRQWVPRVCATAYRAFKNETFIAPRAPALNLRAGGDCRTVECSRKSPRVMAVRSKPVRCAAEGHAEKRENDAKRASALLGARPPRPAPGVSASRNRLYKAGGPAVDGRKAIILRCNLRRVIRLDARARRRRGSERRRRRGTWGEIQTSTHATL